MSLMNIFKKLGNFRIVDIEMQEVDFRVHLLHAMNMNSYSLFQIIKKNQ